MKESTMQNSKRILDAMLQGRKITPFEANQIGNTTDGTRFIRFIREKYPVKSEKVEGELYHRYWIDEAYLAEKIGIQVCPFQTRWRLAHEQLLALNEWIDKQFPIEKYERHRTI